MKHPSTWAERLAYARWLMHFTTGRAPTNADIAKAAKRTSAWVSKWADEDTPPRDSDVHEPLAEFLGVSEFWLFRDRGDPPKPEFWDAWIEERRRPKRSAPIEPREPEAKRPSETKRRRDA